MSLVRAAFLFALLTLIVGIIGSRYLIASLFEHSPQPAVGPISAVHASSTPVHSTPTASPRPSPTAKRPPAATATVRPKPATPTATARPQRPLPTATSSSHPVATAVPMRRPSATAVTTHRPGPHPV